MRGQRMCLCGMLAAEYETLPKPIGEGIVRFFDANHAWLSRVLADGRAARQLTFEGDPGDGAQSVLAGLERAMLLARPYGDPAHFDSAAQRLLATFRPDRRA
jgi:TetR/AcrR family transcriptional repressor of nem operon